MNNLYTVMYHYTRDIAHSRYPGIKGLETKQLRAQLAFMKEHFHIVSMEEVMDAVEGKYELPAKAMLLTFDDGYIDNYTFAFPLLEEFKVQGSFFIPGKTFREHKLLDVNKIHYILASADSRDIAKDLKQLMEINRGGYSYPPTDELWQKYAVANRWDIPETIFIKRMLQTVLPEELRGQIASELFKKYVGISEEALAYELYMTDDQLRTMQRHGMFIGLHGYDHYWLGNLPVEQMQRDTLQALDALDEFIDRKRWVMNYPYGNYSDDVLDFMGKKGAVVGLSTEVRVGQIGKDNPLALPRFDCNDFPPKSENYKMMEA